MTVEAEAGVDLADAANEEFDPVDAVPLAQPAVGRHSHAHIRHLPDHDTLARVPDHPDPDLDLDLFREILAVQDRLYTLTVNPTIGTIEKSRNKWRNEE